MADLLLAADMAYPLDDYARLPKDVRVVLGYVGGETPHVWTAGEVRAAEAAVGTWWPIWTAPNPLRNKDTPDRGGRGLCPRPWTVVAPGRAGSDRAPAPP